MSSFQDLGAEARKSYKHDALNEKTEKNVRVTPLGFYLRDIMSENPWIIKKTTSSVVLLLIYAYLKLFFQLRLHELLQTVYSPKHLLFNRFSNEPVVSHE